MDSRVIDLLEKAKATAMNAASAAGKAADSATKIAGGLFETTKLNLQVFDLNTDIELLFKEIGKSVYLTHTGADIDAEEISAKVNAIDEKYAKIQQLRQNIEERRDSLKCKECGRECERGDTFCRSCGKSL